MNIEEMWQRGRIGLRYLLVATGMIALLGGLWAGLLRLGWAGPILQPALPAAHGPLMVCGFLGTLITLERAVALDRGWAFAAPALVGGGGLLTLFGAGGGLGPLLITIGSAVLVAIFGAVLRIQPAPFAIVMAGGALAWLVGNTLWLAGWPLHRLVPWWMGFLVLTIAGERLELSRMLFHARYVERLFLGLVGALGTGLVLSTAWPAPGLRLLGAALIAIACWLAAYDIARRTVHGQGLRRFIAVCLLLGYVWLAIGGALALRYGLPPGGPLYDATLHAVFVGFVFSMIFGHAPIIFPSVLGIPIRYHAVFYVHVVLLHLTLLARLIGDLGWGEHLQSWGSWGNAVAILLFLLSTLYSVLRKARKEEAASAPALKISPPAAATQEAGATGELHSSGIPAD